MAGADTRELRPRAPRGVRTADTRRRHRRPALDTRAIYRALDERRLQEGLTWRAVADRLGPGWNPPMLTRLADGTGIGFPRVMRIFRWLDRPVADFVCFVPDEDG